MKEQKHFSKRFVKYADGCLWIRVDEIERNLGPIETRQGGLTQEEKLKAVKGKGEGVKI